MSRLVLEVVCGIRLAIQVCVCSQQVSSVAAGSREGSKVKVPEGDMV